MPSRRLWRNRPLMAAVVLLAAVMPAIAGVSSQTQVRLVGLVDENWRGVYDILVRPAGARSHSEVEHNLVEPNFLTFTGSGGIAVSQWQAVRNIEGVEVAAPVAVVGYLETNSIVPMVYLDTSVLPEQTTLFRLVSRVWSTDGVSDQSLSEQEYHFLLPPAVGSKWTTAGGWTGWDGQGDLEQVWVELSDPFALEQTVLILAPIVAVDPDSESRLLGLERGFLQPLRDLKEDGIGRTVAEFDSERLLGGGYVFTSAIRSLQSLGENLKAPVVPVVVSDTFYARVSAGIAVVRVGDPFGGGSQVQDVWQAVDSRIGATEVPLGSVEEEFSEGLVPFKVTPATVGWPGTVVPDGPSGFFSAAQYLASLPSPLHYASRPPRTDDSAVSLEVIPESAGYRTLTTAEVSEAENVVDIREFPFLFGAIGTYDLADLDLPDNPLTWAPLGAYEPPNSRLVAGPDGEPVEPVEMYPTFDVTGLLQPPPLAYTDIEGAMVLRGDSPIDAIRVRVAGLSGFDAEGRRKVEEVAAAIVDMGLEVDIVAGSSPQPVELYVPDYYEDGSDLGWVEQRWSTLGAAERVLSGLTDLNQKLLGLTVGVAALVVGGLQLVSGAVQESRARSLWVLGWSRGRISWWLWGESLVAGAVVTVVALAMANLLGMESVARNAVGIVVGVLVGFGLLGALWAVAKLRGPRRVGWIWDRLLSRIPTSRFAGYSLRRVLHRPLIAAVMVIALAVGASTVAVAGLAVLAATDLAGPTLLAAYGADALRVHQLAMVGLAAVAGFGLFGLMVRTEHRHRRAEFAALRTVGLDRGAIGRITMWQRAFIVLMAAPLAISLARSLDVPSGIAGPIAAGLTLVALAWPRNRQQETA